jgi:predicted nucleic-acid-binding protein
MISIDSNVLIRILVDDDPAQAQKARALVSRIAKEQGKIFLHQIILIETLWVLKRVYGFSKKELISVIEDLLVYDLFTISNSETVEHALEYYKEGKADFSDYLVSVSCRQHKHTPFYTFDKNCSESELFKNLG